MDNSSTSEVVKIDENGRIQHKRQQRQKLMAEFERSTMNGAEFARWAGIKYSTFASWRHKHRKGGSPAKINPEPAPAPALRWVEAMVGREAPVTANRGTLSVQIGPGMSLEISDAEQARLAGVLLRELVVGSRTC